MTQNIIQKYTENFQNIILNKRPFIKPFILNQDSINVLSTNLNLDFYLKNPQIIGEHCYQLRVAVSENPNNLVPKTFFANLLSCDVIKLAQIESGHVYDTALAIRYLLKLNQVYKLFNNS